MKKIIIIIFTSSFNIIQKLFAVQSKCNYEDLESIEREREITLTTNNGLQCTDRFRADHFNINLFTLKSLFTSFNASLHDRFTARLRPGLHLQPRNRVSRVSQGHRQGEQVLGEFDYFVEHPHPPPGGGVRSGVAGGDRYSGGGGDEMLVVVVVVT